MSSGHKRLAFAVAVAVLLGGGWWLFRVTTVENDTVGIVRYKRSFGRIVAIEADRDRDGRAEVVVTYSWSRPYTQGGDSGAGCLDPGHTAEDRNRDGRWDTWYEAVGPSTQGECVYRYSVDMDLDGKPDWSFEAVNGTEAFAAIEERRGF